MKKIDSNQIILAGKVTSSKAWPPKAGWTHTNGRVSINSNGSKIELNIDLTVEKDKNEMQTFNNTFKRGNMIVLSGAQMAGYTKKSGDQVYQISARMSAIGLCETEVNQAIISGTIKRMKNLPSGDLALIIEALYDAKKATPRWRTKEIKILVPKEVATKTIVQKKDRILVTGECKTGDNGSYVVANQATRIY